MPKLPETDKHFVKVEFRQRSAIDYQKVFKITRHRVMIENLLTFGI